VAAGTVLAGGACTAQSDCVAGTTCQNIGGMPLCVRPCRTTADCAVGTACDNTTDGFTLNGVLYGLCHS
jgi:hypothetical protein